MLKPEDSTKSLWRGLNTALTVLVVSAPFYIVQIFGSGLFSVSGDDSLPVSIRASSQADYSRDSQTFTIPPINENILYQIIMDEPSTYTAQDRAATLQADLSSPVPTMIGNTQPVTVTPTPTLPPQTLISTVLATTPATTITPLATVTPHVTSTPITASTATPSLPLSLPTIPPILPTIQPLLPTIPPILPTIPPLLPTIPPILPTVLPLVPTLVPALPTAVPLVPTITSLLPTLIPPLFP